MPIGLEKHTDLTQQIIAACYEVHNILGPGLEERFYRDALAFELELRGLQCRREQQFQVKYKGKTLGIHQLDLIVEDKVLVELKAVSSKLMSVHVAQAISERKVSKVAVALLVNFGESSVQIRRLEDRAGGLVEKAVGVRKLDEP